MKTSYGTRCCEKSQIAAHSINYALSDPKHVELQEKHNNSEVCPGCFDLCHSMVKIQAMSEENGADEHTVYDINMANKNIQEYFCHILCNSQQKKTKVWCMENLTTEKLFWLKEFCQNILSVQFPEGQHDYFGKKGNHCILIFSSQKR